MMTVINALGRARLMRLRRSIRRIAPMHMATERRLA